MIYTFSREGGIDYSPVLNKLRQQNIPVLDSEALHQEELKLKSEDHLFEHFGEHSPRFRDLWGAQKDYYLSFLRLSVYRFAAQGSGLIYGHGASFILSQLPAIMKVKLIAPEEYRVQLVAKTEEINEHEARTLIHKRERERIGYHRFFFDANWNEDSCYDVVLNISSTNFSNILETALHTPFPPEHEEQRTKLLHDLICAEELYMKLLFDEKLFIDLLKVDFSLADKNISIQGIIGDSKTQDKALQLAQKLYPDFQVETLFESMQSSYLYFPSVPSV